MQFWRERSSSGRLLFRRRLEAAAAAAAALEAVLESIEESLDMALEVDE